MKFHFEYRSSQIEARHPYKMTGFFRIAGLRQIVLTSLQSDEPRPSNFTMRQVSMPEPSDGEILAQTLEISFDAANRGKRMTGVQA